MTGGNKFDSYYAGGGPDGDSFTREEHFDSEELRLSGSATVDSARARNIRITGSGHVSGSLVGETLECSGSMHVGGSISAASIRVTGSMHSDGPIGSETFSLAGSGTAGSIYAERELKVAGSIQADRVSSGGRLSIAGSVHSREASAVALEINGDGRVEGIRCTDATINRGLKGTRLISLFGKRSRMKLEIGRLEAKRTVNIDRCAVEEISADSVHIGRDCSVGSVRYRTTCDVEEGAELRSQPVKV